MASQKIVWHGKRVQGEIRRQMESRLLLAAEMLRGQVVRAVSSPVTVTKGPRGGRVVTNRSKPGEPPHADLGKLRQSIFSQLNRRKLTAIVGTTLDKGLALELGTSRMKARPFLVPTLARMRPAITRILTKKIR